MIDFDAMVLAPINEAFGQPVNYPGNPNVSTGIFTDGYKQPVFNADGSTTWNTSAPTLGVRSSDFSGSPRKDDLVTVTDRNSVPKQYRVQDSRPDGVGWIVLTLKVAA